MTARLLEVTDARALSLPDLIVADSEAAADLLARAVDVPHQQIATVFAGAEERVFCEEWSPIYPFGALHVALDGPSYATVLEAASLVPELPVRIVGRDDASTPDNVEWLSTPYDDLGIAYAHAGIAIGSLAEDVVIPDAAFQALATGTPLVTADTAAARELLVDGESALLVQPMDAGALASALRRLAEDESLRLRLSREGRRVYEERASEVVLGAQWRALLEPLAQTGTA
jgi:glycosyltransferase involved in cell wall biosynthesis